MRLRHKIILALATALPNPACAPGVLLQNSTPSTSSGPITKAELNGTNLADAYEAVLILRPHWLRSRMSTGASDGLPKVYVQGMRYGSIHELRRFRVAGIREIRYVDAPNATTRWGMGHSDGVIEVIELRRP